MDLKGVRYEDMDKIHLARCTDQSVLWTQGFITCKF
jgi:hypothetical protein